MRLRLPAVAVAVAVTCAAAAAPAAGQTTCDPMQTPPQFRGAVPKLDEVVPAPGGENGEVTTDQAYAYMDAVDRASDRVITGALPRRTWQGRELRWAIIGNPGRLSARGLHDVQTAAQRLRDPQTPPSVAAHLAHRYPAILWVASNVHGGEESGTDASLRVLYELADRDDCAARQILDNALVVLLPIQNPDGREADTRRNYYGFDMNRDWFARTQPETDGKVAMLRAFPGPMFIDAHEMSRPSFFFPPNADPIYHEITDESVDWINNVYGEAVADEFTREGIPFFNRDVYDLFYMGYGDTVPSTGFISAGMTYEKSSEDPIATRAYEQYVTQWVSLSQGAVRKETILRDWAAAWRHAYAEGVAGKLEPNEVVNPGNEVQTQVPDGPVRHYFLRADDPSKWRKTLALVRRLQRMDVDVYRLSRPLHVDDFTPYGRAARRTVMPAGTWWIPMAQMQKHWVQAMLNENTYTPFPYFYDVTAWSQPLLFNVQGGYSGERLRPRARLAREVRDPGTPLVSHPPSIALLQLSAESTSAIESSGWLRYLLEQVWHVPYTDVTPAQIAAGGLAGKDVLLVPNGPASDGQAALGDAGARALRDWVNGGGHYIGWRGGTELAALLGLTTPATLTDPTSDVPGSLFRVRVSGESPLSRGVGPFAYAFYEYDDVMRASSPEHVAVSFPPTSSGDWFISGFASRAEELGGTAAVVDEPVGSGRTTVFSVDPNYRAFTNGTQRILRNAMLGRTAGGAHAARAGAPARSAREAKARRAARRLDRAQAPLHLTVRRSSAARAAGVLRRLGARYRTARRSHGRTAFTIANPHELTAEEHPFAELLPGALNRSRVAVVAFRAP